MNNKLDLAVRVANHLLTLPEGSWPETQQAKENLDECLPRGMTREQVMEIAKTQHLALKK